jgi:hypothetical protein
MGRVLARQYLNGCVSDGGRQVRDEPTIALALTFLLHRGLSAAHFVPRVSRLNVNPGNRPRSLRRIRLFVVGQNFCFFIAGLALGEESWLWRRQ